MQSRAQRRVRLNQIAISSPCSLPWEAMPGDDRIRFCGECKQNVYNIAGLTEQEATRLIVDRRGRFCGRITRRPDGTIVTADCWTRLRAARRRGLLHLAAVMLLVVVPELLSMRFGIGRLWRLVGSADAAPPAPPHVALPLAPADLNSLEGPGGIDLSGMTPWRDDAREPKGQEHTLDLGRPGRR